MLTTIYLTEKERSLYDALSPQLKAGWTMTPETITATETPHELSMRYQIATLTDPAVLQLLDKARSANTPEDFTRIAGTFDVASLSQEQLAELIFVMGTKSVSLLIRYLLSEVQDDEDIEGVAALTLIRHMLLQSNAGIES